MAPVKALASYKKKEGTLDISKDGKSVIWTPLHASAPEVTILVSRTDRECYKHTLYIHLY